MSAGLFRGTKSRENGTARGRARALLVLGGAIGIAGVLSVVAQATAPPAYDATAKLTPGLYYIGDAKGSLYTFTVTNTGTTAGIGAVEIRRPSTGWTVSGCVPPAGWTSQLAADKCRFRSAASTSDDLKPGQSMTFKLGAKTAPGNVNRAGTWPVAVSKSNHFDNVSLLRNARSTGSGLATTLYTFELTTAVVSDTLKAAGTTCPPADKDAIVGATTNVIVCGRNRANVALAPSSAYSSLSGTFLKTSGTFSSATIQPNSGDVVLGRWSGAVVSETFGSGRKLVTHIGSASNRTSPLRTFTGYSATSAVPVAVADAHTTDEDTPLNVVAPGLLANDTNAEAGETLTAVDATQPSNGTVVVNPDGSFTYTPNANFNGTDSFTYKTFDTYTKSGAATVTITVTPVNDAPAVVDLTDSTPEDTAKVVVLNGSDPDSASLSYTIVDDPDHGTLGAVVGNAVTYTPSPDYNGPDSFSYKANDGSADSNVATVSITVDAVNDAPVGVADAYSTNEDSALSVPASGVLGNDTDVEASSLTATLVAGPQHAQSFVLNPDGSFDYTPVADHTGSDSFTYTAGDGGLTSAVTTVTITVDGVNDAPVAQNLGVSTAEDTAAPVTLLATDADGTTPAYTIVTGPANGSLGAISGDSVTYTPDANYAGPDSFTYKAGDGTATSNVATVTIDVTPVNDLPVADDDAYSTNEDVALTVAAPGVLNDDSDVEGPMTAVLDRGPSHGTLTLNADGSFVYTPSLNYSGSDEFTYTVSDGTESSPVATVALTVDPVNDAPVANNAMASATEDTAKTVTLTGSDVEGSALTYSIVTGPAHGSLGAVSGNEVTYTPDANYNGPDSFTFKANDGTLDSASPAEISITVNAVNDAPVQTNDAYVTNEDTALNVPAAGVLGNDFDVDSAQLYAILVSGPEHGTLLLEGDGSFVYTPSANYNGPDSFTYEATDNALESGVATVTLSVNAVNDAPTTLAVAATTAEDTAKVVTLSGADQVEGSPVTFSIVAGPANGSLGAVSGNEVTYTPDANYNGTDSFTFKANDGTADSNVSTATLTVTAVNDAPSFAKGANVTVLQDSGAQTVAGWATAIAAGPANEAGQALTFNATATDTALFSGQPAVAPNGDLTFTPASGVTGSTTVTVTLSDNAGGDDTSAPQTFTITISPPNATPVAAAKTASGNEDGGAIVVTLTGTDDDGDALTFAPGAAGNGVITTPAGVSCTAGACTATVTYTPNANFSGTDTFTYTVNDGTIDSAAATVTVTVNPVNDAPSFTKGADQTVNEDAGGQTVTGWATGKSAGAANESAQVVTYEVTGTTNDGLFAVLPTVNPAGDLAYTPAANASGSATVSVRAVDDGGTANGGVDTSPVQTFTVTVRAVNDAPSFTKGADQTVNEDSVAQSVSNWASAISKGPADESAQTLSFTTSNDNNALFSVQPGVTPTGTLAYTPAPNAVGSATVTITLADNGGVANGGDDTSDAQTFTITVNGVNDAPSFTHGGNQAVNEDAGAQTVNGFVTGTSAGPADESAQTVTVAVTNVTNPTLFSAAPTITNGVLTYTPAADANGVSTVTAQATDDGGTANGGVASGTPQTFTIDVAAVNDAPSFAKGADQTLNEDAGPISVSNWATAISSGPANESGQTVTFGVTNNNNGLFSSQPAISPAGTLSYTSAANKYGTATVSVTIADNGGTLNGGDDTSGVQTFTITVNAVNDAPVAAAKSYDVQTNMKRSITGLLAGATDPNDVAGNASWSPTFTVGSVTPGADCVGCTVSNIDNAAGSFDFEPPAGGTGTYTVSYTVVDSGHPAPGATSAAQTITFTVSGDVIWFADATSGDDASGNGTLARPFKTLAAVSTVDLANQKVFLSPGTYSSSYTLLNGGWLTGAGAKSGSFDSLMGITPPAGTIARPAINGTNPTVSASVTLGSGNTVRGLTFTGANALSGTSFGTLTLGNNAASTADVAISSTGQALNLTTGTITGDFTGVTSSGGTNNVSLTSVATTTATSLGSGALSAATSDGFKVSGGNGTFTYSGTIGNASSGAAVSVANKTGGTITLSGAVSDTSGAGVALTNNGGATNNLTGGVTLTSGSGNAFVATGGGTVSVTGAANTITSTSGTALNIANTTIGASDVTFRSISSNGATKGIVLDNTGSTGNLTVIGNGGTCTIANTSGCSGGTIANASGGEDSGVSPVGTGIVLNNTVAPSFTRMNVASSSNYGIRGTSVTGLTLDNVVLTGTHGGTTAAAAGAPYNEGGMLFDNLNGTVSFTAVQATGGHAGNIEVNNTTGTLNATMSNLLLGANSTAEGNDSLQVEGSGTATVNLTVQNSTLTAARGDLFQYIASGSGGGALTFTGNTLTNSHPAIATGGGGVSLSGGAGGNVTMNVTSNTMRDSVGHALLVVKNPGGGSLTGTINGNTIGVAGVANSGSSEGSGMKIQHAGTGTMSFAVTGNTVRQYNNTAIDFQAGAGVMAGGTFTNTISGNTIANPGSNPATAGVPRHGIQINSGVTAGDSFVTCADFGANSLVGSGAEGGVDVRVRHRQSTTVKLPGYAGTQYDTTAVNAFVLGKVGAGHNVAAATSTTGPGYVGTAC